MNARTRLVLQIVVAAVAIAGATDRVAASSVPCRSSVPMWCLDWESVYEVWDPDGTKDYQDLPEDLLTATLVDRKANRLLVGPVLLGGAEKPFVATMVLDDRIESLGWTEGFHLHSSSSDDLDLRLIIHAAPNFTDPELALPNQGFLPLDADFRLGGVLKLGDEAHVWLFPAYSDDPVVFKRLRAAGTDTAKGFGAYVDLHVANGHIEADTLTLYIDADADGEPERTITAAPLTEEEHQKLILAAQARSSERASQVKYLPVAPTEDWQWEWLRPRPTGSTMTDVCLGTEGDLLAVDTAGFVLRRRGGRWAVDGDQLDEGLRHIVSAPDGQVYVASTSRIWRRNGGHWIDMGAPVVRNIGSIFAWEGQRIIAVSIDGDVLQYGPDGWVQSAPGGQESWTAVWGATPDDVWITGFSQSVFHFDGRTWAPVEHQLTGQIEGVWGFGPREVYFITSASGGGMVWRWSGEGRWRQLKIPNIPWASVRNFRGNESLIDLSTGGRIISISQNGWEQLEGMPDYALGAICRDGAGQLVGVGEYGRTWEYGSAGWHEVEPWPLPLIRSVWGLNADDLYAVSDNGRVWQWDGMKLTEMDSLTEFNLQGIWGSSRNDIHVAGVRGIWHWDGRTWQQTWEPWLGGVAFGFELWGSGPGDVWAIGSGGAIVHFEGKTWERVEGVTDNDLYAIWGSGADNIYIGGERTLIRFDGVRWEPVPGFKRHRVTRLWGSGPRDVWAATDQGLLHFDGETWEPTRLREYTNGVWGTCATNVFTLTATHLLQFDGIQWRSVRRADAGMIAQIWGMPGQHVMAFGDGGSVLRLRR